MNFSAVLHFLKGKLAFSDIFRTSRFVSGRAPEKGETGRHGKHGDIAAGRKEGKGSPFPGGRENPRLSVSRNIF